MQEFEQRLVGIISGANGVVRQNELAKSLAEERRFWLHPRGAKARRLGIGIGIERGIIDCARARPEAGAAYFVRISLTGDRIGQVRHAAGMAGRATAGKPRHREIEAPPEEMHRARLAEEAGAELFEHPVGIDEDLEEATHRVAVVGRVVCILREFDRRR